MAGSVVQGGGLTEEDADLEVAAVLSKGLWSDPTHAVSPSKRYSSATSAKHNYSPFRLSTVMTNISRGNTRTCTPSVHNLTIHQMAAQGELVLLRSELQDAFVNQPDEYGLTLLAWATSNDQEQTVEYLLERGADVNLAGEKGETPILLAASCGHDRILKILLASGANIDHTCSQGQGALLYAAYNNNVECVKVLLEMGADMTARDAHNHTAYEIVIIKGYKDVQQVMEQHMLQLLEGT